MAAGYVRAAFLGYQQDPWNSLGKENTSLVQRGRGRGAGPHPGVPSAQDFMEEALKSGTGVWFIAFGKALWEIWD